jgi:hypothetical protein
MTGRSQGCAGARSRPGCGVRVPPVVAPIEPFCKTPGWRWNSVLPELTLLRSLLVPMSRLPVVPHWSPSDQQGHRPPNDGSWPPFSAINDRFLMYRLQRLSGDAVHLANSTPDMMRLLDRLLNTPSVPSMSRFCGGQQTEFGCSARQLLQCRGRIHRPNESRYNPRQAKKSE